MQNLEVDQAGHGCPLHSWPGLAAKLVCEMASLPEQRCWSSTAGPGFPKHSLSKSKRVRARAPWCTCREFSRPLGLSFVYPWAKGAETQQAPPRTTSSHRCRCGRRRCNAALADQAAAAQHPQTNSPNRLRSAVPGQRPGKHDSHTHTIFLSLSLTLALACCSGGRDAGLVVGGFGEGLVRTEIPPHLVRPGPRPGGLSPTPPVNSWVQASRQHIWAASRTCKI